MKTHAQLISEVCELEKKVQLLQNVNNVVNDASTARVLSLGDAGDYIRFTNAGAITVTVPADSVTNFPIGTQIVIRRATGAGVITLAGTPVINDDDSAGVAAGGVFAIKKINTNEWDFI